MKWDLIASWWMHRKGQVKSSLGRLLGRDILVIEGERDQYEAELRGSIARGKAARTSSFTPGGI